MKDFILLKFCIIVYSNRRKILFFLLSTHLILCITTSIFSLQIKQMHRSYTNLNNKYKIMKNKVLTTFNYSELQELQKKYNITFNKKKTINNNN